MAEYIEREALLADIDACVWITSRPDRPSAEMRGANKVINRIKAVPAADVAPVVHGKWIWDENGMDWGLGAWVCSECHAKPETWWEGSRKFNPLRCSGSRYCGNCGAKMNGGQDDV